MSDRRDDGAEGRPAKMARHGDGDGPAVAVQDSGGEISLSIEETNKLRISLGLKPLNMEQSKQSSQDQKRQEEERKKQEQERMAADLRARIAAHKSARQQESFLAVKTLGSADGDDDDMASFVERTRQAAAKKAQEERQAAQARQQQQRQERRPTGDEDDEEEEEEGRGGYDAKDLAGLKVKHDMDDLGVGEEVVLTLADRGILDEKGNLDEAGDDELENVRLAEERKRKKAREAAAPKAKPLWEEDGKRRGILDKYDEEDEQILRLDGQGNLGGDDQRREEMRKKLEAAGKVLDSALENKPAAAAGDYYTSADLAKSKGGEEKKRKKKERKLRSKPTAAEDGEEGDTGDLIAALEAQAQDQDQAGTSTATGKADLGSRTDRATARERAAAAEKASAAEKRARFDAALQKSNWASLALRGQGKADEEVEEELFSVRVGQATQAKSSLDAIAAAAAKRREEEEAKAKEETKGGLVMNDTMDFVINIGAKKEEDAGPVAKTGPVLQPEAGATVKVKEEDEDDGYMGVDAKEEAEEAEDDRKDREDDEAKASAQGRWVTASAEAADAMDVDDEEKRRQERRNKRKQRQKEQEQEQEKPSGLEGVTMESKVGKGLAGVLGLLKDKGTLQEKQIWAGRNSDKSKVNLQGLEDVYTGGSSEDRVVRSVEMALTRKDEFGRVMTPKERFRQLCYQFHGKGPSKNKIEKKWKQAQEELAVRKLASEQAEEADKLLKVQEKTAQPFIVLSGKGAKETLAAVASANKAAMPPPPTRPPAGAKKGGKEGAKPKEPSLGGVLGGGLTPITGDRKVEAMLSLAKQ